MLNRFFIAFMLLASLTACRPDCSKKYVGSFSLSSDGQKWIPAPTERAFAFVSQSGARDSFRIGESTQGPNFYNETNEQACHNFDGQHWLMNFEADSLNLTLISEVITNPNREMIRLGMNDFALFIDLKDYKIVALDTEIGNINGEVTALDTVTFGPRMFLDVIRVNVLDPGNELGFTQFHYSKSVGFVHFLQAPSLEWVRE